VHPERACDMTRRQAHVVINRIKAQTGPDFVVTFGKHKGKRLKEIPRGYLEWMLKENVNRDGLSDHIRETLNPQKKRVAEECPF